eukprot:346247-Prymnesium_polylepis.1
MGSAAAYLTRQRASAESKRSRAGRRTDGVPSIDKLPAAGGAPTSTRFICTRCVGVRAPQQRCKSVWMEMLS